MFVHVHNKNINQIKKEPKISDPEQKIGEQEKAWKQFVKERTEGKKFQSRQAVNDYMKQLSKE